jgi:cyclase
VDTGSSAFTADVLAAVKALSPKLPIQYVVNTQFKDDHSGGNETIAKAGTRIAIGFAFGDARSQAAIVAHENILSRMSARTGQAARPVGAWPTDTFFAPTKEIYFNNEAIILYHDPAETDGDTFVFFRKSDVVAAGDIYVNTTFPVIDVAAGGHINGVIKGLNDILEVVIPANNVEDGTLVIPGEGRLADELDVAEYRDMVTIVRDRVQDGITRGLTKQQVLADRRMALEYDARYGRDPKWTTAMFLDAVYTNLTTK